MFKKRTVMGCLLSFGMLLNVSVAKADIIELALVLDSSGSISNSDYALQLDAYEDIFSTNFVTDFVNAGDELWVSVYQFSSSTTLEIAATLLDTDAAATAFSALFGSISKDNSSTDTTEAVDTAAADLLTADVMGDRLIIDVSTDGEPNNTTTAIQAAANASAQGVTVNAIGVGSGVSESFLDSFTTAGDGFYVTAVDFEEFRDSLEIKLLREISNPTEPVPAPATLGLLGLAIAFIARKKLKAN